MPSCSEQLFIDWDKCDELYQAEKVACNGDPECIHQALLRRQACENAAWLRYIQCIGQTSTLNQPQSQADGAPGCGCGGG